MFAKANVLQDMINESYLHMYSQYKMTMRFCCLNMSWWETDFDKIEIDDYVAAECINISNQ